MAYKCGRADCGGFRWSDIADERGERHCTKCGGQFPKRPVRMPFCRKGPPSTLGGKGAGQVPDAQASASGAAAAKAKAKAKTKAQPSSQEQPRPWNIFSATGERSASEGGGDLRLDPKRASDDIHRLEAYSWVARFFGDKEVLQNLEANRRKALQAKADKMPPSQRVDHLKKRYKEAMDELRKLIAAQEATDAEIRKLQTLSRE